jgi:hypothetical protein
MPRRRAIISHLLLHEENILMAPRAIYEVEGLRLEDHLAAPVRGSSFVHWSPFPVLVPFETDRLAEEAEGQLRIYRRVSCYLTVIPCLRSRRDATYISGCHFEFQLPKAGNIPPRKSLV